MNGFLASLKWIVGAVIFIVGLNLGVEAYKSGESIFSALGVAGFGVVFLLIVSFLGDSSGCGEGANQEELERYRSSKDGNEHSEGWHE
ncbi:hypothetical protein E4634_21010 [Mangrovimicrobium sediminis]|uniref:Uncharacterized protein n=1 Tax=Mangrovimicrobium sediminis TaxID=2562682 RepID=A0A4Z0LTA3_9GAMM|nr:hypothetical protein [Haliea sp. SAOS-164]TGD70530.1 hypothetical protein E4634_21010 [Haliea sp. SAOS-164]